MIRLVVIEDTGSRTERSFDQGQVTIGRSPESDLVLTAQDVSRHQAKIVLKDVPESGKVWLVRGGEPLERDAVLAQWRSTLFLRDARIGARGWLIETMKCVEAMGRESFTLADAFV